MGQCHICGDRSHLISSQLGVCLSCIREKPEEAIKITDMVHTESRKRFGLPPKPSRDPNGILCGICSNDCKIGFGDKGFCGLVSNIEGRLIRIGGTAEKGILQWYYDPLPTNCVAWWFCPGCTGAGYPKYGYKRGAETGYVNLAVFYGACSYDCLFCQNWNHRNLAAKLGPIMSAETLAAKVDDKVSCVCFFGGDPSPQMPHALKVSEVALKRAREKGRIFRVCWETNGNWKDKFALKAAELSLISGGCIKFDLKTCDSNLNLALCGISNKSTLQSFKMIGKRYFKKRLEPSILTASTLLIPGYVDSQEVDNITRFIAEIDPRIPYTLLGFYSTYIMNDLPTTSREQAYRCRDVAEKHLEKVRIGNVHLLS